MTKKKPGKHLQFYMDCINNDCTMPSSFDCPNYGGLCNVVDMGLISYEIFKLFSEGQNPISFWATGNNRPYDNRFTFTPLRQTIVLFMAAINDEL